MTQIMFETFNMPAMYVAIQAVLWHFFFVVLYNISIIYGSFILYNIQITEPKKLKSSDTHHETCHFNGASPVFMSLCTFSRCSSFLLYPSGSFMPRLSSCSH